MKLRKLLAVVLTLALGLSLAAPAMAAEAADARLTQVTLAVKGTLDIGDEYTEFYGEPQETPLGTRWDLEWTGEDHSLSVTATDAGKVLSLYRRTDQDISPYYAGGSYNPSFPAMTRAQALESARAFLGRVLTAGELAIFDDTEEESLSAEDYSFQGSIQLNGLPSPMTFFVRVRLSDGQVTRFWRGDESDYAGAPGEAATSTTAEKAAELLKTTLSLRLEYVQDEAGEMAVLRYLSNSTDEFYVDAATGELVNLTELRQNLNRQYAGGAADKFFATNSAAPEEAADAGLRLTDTELEGVAKLEDVLDKDALDKAIQAWTELELKDYTLGSANYSVDRETGDVTARVSYAKNTEEGIYRRYVTLDAKTGELVSMYGYNPGRMVLMDENSKEYRALLTAQAAQSKAESFLKKLWGDQFAKTERYNDVDPQAKAEDAYFTFAQKVNGYFFPDNSISVRVDGTDGSILGFSKNFDDTVTFDSPDGLIDQAAAIDVWCASFPVELGYMEIPVALDMTEEFELLRNAGYSYYNALKPGYALGDREVWYTGVDAKTGELTQYESSPTEKVTYDDLEGHWAKDIFEELARYNVGWTGGKAQPDKELTQLDYILLLASANGYGPFDPADQDSLDALYNFAYRQNLLTKAERQEDKILTRSDMIKMLLDGMGYGPVANLTGIFRCDFADAAAIPEAHLGYAALAQGLGLVSGDSQSNYAPARTAIRSEAAALLWQYLKR